MTGTTLGSLAATGVLSLGDGYRTKQSELANEGFRIVRVADVKDGRVSFDGPDSVSTAYSRQIGAKCATAGDVLLTTKGTIGRVAVVPDSPPPAVYSPQLCWFRVTRADVIQPRYLAYWLQSPAFLTQASYMQGNTDMAPYISLSDLRDSKIDLPSPGEQQAIAEVLGALDDKIAANTAVAKCADELMHFEFRAAPKGREVPLSATAEFINGKAFTKGASGTGRVVVRIAELNNGISASTVYSDSIVDDKHVARPGDILFAWSGSLTLHRWFRAEAIVNQHIFKVIPKAGYPTWLAYELLRHKLDDYRAIAADKATTMGHIQRHHLDEPIDTPSPETIDRLDALMSGLWSSALSAEQESLTLMATRDALLPQLMSGKLRVRDAEKIAADAGA